MPRPSRKKACPEEPMTSHHASAPKERVYRNPPCHIKKLLLSFVCLVFLAAFASATLRAQTGGGGAIEGTVTDSTGAVVPNATVTATNVATGQQTTQPTTSRGLYSISPLLPGRYTIAVK